MVSLFLLPVSVRAQDPPKFITVAVEGPVQYQEAASGAWKTLKRGDLLPEGSRVSTGPQASCTLSRQGDEAHSALMLKPDSSLILKSLGNSTQVYLEDGSLFSKIRKMKREMSFEVRTPTAVATVRGTGWLQSADLLEVFEGTVHVEGNDGSQQDVGEGQGLPIGPDGHLGGLQPADKGSQEEWDDFAGKGQEPPDWTQDDFGDDTQDPADPILDSKEDQQQIEGQSRPLEEKDETNTGGGPSGS